MPQDRIDPNVPTSPFAGVVSINMANAAEGSFLCSGALISLTHVITAAHCLDVSGGFPSGDGIADFAPGDVTVVFNHDNPTNNNAGATLASVSEIALHPDWHGFNNLLAPEGPSINDDLAILTLSAAAPAGVPIYPISTTPFNSLQQIVLAGYGTQGDGVGGYDSGTASFYVKLTGENVSETAAVDDEGTGVAEVWLADFDGPKPGSNTLNDGLTLGNDIEVTLGGGDSGGPSFLWEDHDGDTLIDVGELVWWANNTFVFGGPMSGVPSPPLFGSQMGGMVGASYLEFIEEFVPLDAHVIDAIVNGTGNPNRSGIASLTLEFDQLVNINSTEALTLFNHTTSQIIDLTPAMLVNNGTSSVTWDLATVTLPDGRYTAELLRSEVTATVGRPLAQTFTFEFHVLSGDTDGDSVVNFNDTVPLSQNFGQSGSRYREGDGDGDGLVNFNDTVPLSLNFGASLAPLTFDFGDAPEDGTSFPTTLAKNGPRHVITGNTLFLGADRDGESDGQPLIGDGDDEDGLLFDPLIAGTNVDVTVTSSGAGFIGGWIDFNADGDWDDPGEQVFSDVPIVANDNNLEIAVPSGATLGSTSARFRLTSGAGYSYFGLAPNGEVEDYQLDIVDASTDLSADLAEETHTRPARSTTPAERLPSRLSENLIGILTPTFTTFEHPLSQVASARRSRPSGP